MLEEWDATPRSQWQRRLRRALAATVAAAGTKIVQGPLPGPLLRFAPGGMSTAQSQ